MAAARNDRTEKPLLRDALSLRQPVPDPQSSPSACTEPLRLRRVNLVSARADCIRPSCLRGAWCLGTSSRFRGDGRLAVSALLVFTSLAIGLRSSVAGMGRGPSSPLVTPSGNSSSLVVAST